MVTAHMTRFRRTAWRALCNWEVRLEELASSTGESPPLSSSGIAMKTWPCLGHSNITGAFLFVRESPASDAFSPGSSLSG